VLRVDFHEDGVVIHVIERLVLTVGWAKVQVHEGHEVSLGLND
jgi:hypothetical protein